VREAIHKMTKLLNNRSINLVSLHSPYHAHLKSASTRQNRL
jgi:hypothetical protein